MATAEASAVIRADAMARLSRAAPDLAAALGIDPPAPVAGEAAKDPALREARTLESLAAFIDAAAGVASNLRAELDARRADPGPALSAAADSGGYGPPGSYAASPGKRKGR